MCNTTKADLGIIILIIHSLGEIIHAEISFSRIVFVVYLNCSLDRRISEYVFVQWLVNAMAESSMIK